MIFVGDDWAEAHHDVCLMDEDGTKLAAGRLPEGLAGVARLHQMVGEHTSDPGEVVVGIETDRGLWVAALVAAGYRVYAINPVAVSRYRDRHSLGGAKSDRADAKLLADLVRTDHHNHRPVAGDSTEAEGIKIMARAHQNLIWARVRHTNQSVTRCGSTIRQRWKRSMTWPIAMLWPSWGGRPPPPSVPA